MKDYWNFSFHEIGYFDLPAMIDYMLMSTNQTQFFSVGYSQGTSATMVMLTNRPEYNQKIIQTHLVAPAIFLKHLQSPGIKLLAKKRTQQLIKDSGMFKNPPVIRLLTNLCNIYCKEPIFFMCQSVFYYIFGPTTGETEMSAVSSINVIAYMYFNCSFS